MFCNATSKLFAAALFATTMAAAAPVADAGLAHTIAYEIAVAYDGDSSDVVASIHLVDSDSGRVVTSIGRDEMQVSDAGDTIYFRYEAISTSDWVVDEAFEWTAVVDGRRAGAQIRTTRFSQRVDGVSYEAQTNGREFRGGTNIDFLDGLVGTL